jgi:hypothetical protein
MKTGTAVSGQHRRSEEAGTDTEHRPRVASLSERTPSYLVRNFKCQWEDRVKPLCELSIAITLLQQAVIWRNVQVISDEDGESRSSNPSEVALNAKRVRLLSTKQFLPTS